MRAKFLARSVLAKKGQWKHIHCTDGDQKASSYNEPGKVKITRQPATQAIFTYLHLFCLPLGREARGTLTEPCKHLIAASAVDELGKFTASWKLP